jgi:nucleoid DNA-binding protein
MRRNTDSETESTYTGRALTKRDIAIQLAEKFDINQLDATKIVQSVLDQIIASLEKG